jgi:hypothetical protein
MAFLFVRSFSILSIVGLAAACGSAASNAAGPNASPGDDGGPANHDGGGSEAASPDGSTEPACDRPFGQAGPNVALWNGATSLPAIAGR